MKANTLHFSVKTGIKNIVGKDLITDDNIAIFELVKNSYDAYASKVIITFEDDKITIADNGKGMSLDDIQKKWLALAYSAKKDGSEDENIDETFLEKRKSYRDNIKEKRRYAGAKGIGRLSCDRLGTELLLTTKKYDSTSTEQLKINWKDFEQEDNQNFTDVAISHYSLDKYSTAFPDDANSGTILEISKISYWDREKIKTLKHSLEKLINPFSESNDFQIQIICEREKKKDEKETIERNKVNGEVKNSILDVIKLKTTEIEVEVNSETISTTIKDRGVLIYHIEEKNIYNPFIDKLNINLYYLNRSAKINFNKIMNLQPVKYGSIFLFKNGFRVQPYGTMGDDSWRLDFRAQQGHNRFLGTRDLFGRVDIITDDAEQFKEVSNREGGLVNTMGYQQLMNIFEISHRRLERYVVGVLWGEAFKKKGYFKNENDVEKFRDLLKNDKDSEEFNVAKNNIGSKIDFIQLLKSLSNEENIEIKDYNKDLVDLVNEKLDVVQPKFLNDLEKLSEKLNDIELKKTYHLTQQNFSKLENEKLEAEKKLAEEERKRKLAEEKAVKEEEKRIEAEKKALEAEKKKQQAELEKEKKEKERALAELNRLKAEQAKKEEEEKRKEAEKETEKAKTELETEKKISAFKGALIGTEKEKIIGLQHQIFHSSGRINRNIQLLLKYLGEHKIDDAIKKYISIISLETSKVHSIAQFITKANFNLKATEINTDVVSFMKDYLEEIYTSDEKIIDSKVKIKIIDNQISAIKSITPLEMTTLIDNFINNAEKADATEIIFEFSKEDTSLNILIKDNGKGIQEKIIGKIFELGYTTTNGAGIGLFQNKNIVSKLGGNILVKSKINQGTLFKIILPL